MISFEITDALTGKTTTVRQTPHDAQCLYRALRELFGDVQMHMQPGELVTVPDVHFKIAK